MNIVRSIVPPDDFDPVTASLDALRAVRNSPACRPQAEPGLRALWDKAFRAKTEVYCA